MKFLIDECLIPGLARLARERGHTESTHISWLGLSGAPDHLVARRAVDGGYVFVTHNTVDFRGLYGREGLHAGLISINTPARMMTLALQRSLFLQALIELGDEEPYNFALELTVRTDRSLIIERYRHPP